MIRTVKFNKFDRFSCLIYLESQNSTLAGSTTLGGAAPLSSRKTGYLLRVAHMIPIIFPALRGRTRPSAGLHSLASLASLCLRMHGTNFFNLVDGKNISGTLQNKKIERIKMFSDYSDY